MSLPIPKFREINRGTKRKPNYWVAYSVPKLGEIREPTGARTKADYLEFVRGLARRFQLGTWTNPKGRKASSGAGTFASYAPQVIARRSARGVATAHKDESGHVQLHLIPLFGEMQLREITFIVVRDAFKTLADKGLAGRTMRNIHSTLRQVLIEALEDGLIEHVPQSLTVARGHLPPKVDKDPTWRETAVFDRDEIGTLLRCEKIPPQFRVMYATYFLAATRASELLPIKLSDYDRTRKPLPAITVLAKKGGRARGKVYRVVPVHPDLKLWLDWWIDEGYEITHGERLKPSDALFPTMSARRRRQGLEAMSYSELYTQWWRNHLPDAELRHRRLHDSRRTFMSIARGSGAPRDVARAITHTTTGDRILDDYTTLEWGALCAAISQIAWRLPAPPMSAPAKVVDIERARR